ncbi:hypothetical protein FA95DRAFT_411632 [Auriscalpium vulgare]|uniref:Uncharacterized protein n=1 Tax=Auriscalpium vulgare TaxID=40419 RepID=A0ACB8RHW2_9AGAM|nr:hypothetical protein FA95DRAFT_411632 [Auriscalpium vulgare]
MPKEEVEKLMVIVGGDQSTVEKLRTLKKFMASCPHGYSRYGWVLPLIQLWHMGWADLERVLSTHWGESAADDLSSFKSTNIILGRKVKDVKRPDFYPAQHLVFDNLKVEILECWRKCLGVADLEAHFAANNVEAEDLFTQARELNRRYLTMDAYERALYPDTTSADFFPIGQPWSTPASTQPIAGDQVLANGILRRRDSMLHLEYQYGLADGDIGRAFNIMAVWTFTFPGSGRNKYANEMLELACNFEFEYSAELQLAIKNNWLCNLSGFDGCWFPQDLLQEKNIKQLKKMSQRRDASFGGSFFQEVVSLNIRAFIGSIKSMRTMVLLQNKGESHRRAEKKSGARELTRRIDEHGLLTFRAGRTSGHVAQDDFEVGFRSYAANDSKKIRDFVERTIQDMADLHSAEEMLESTTEHVLEDLPLPNMVIDGELVDGEMLETFYDEDADDNEATGVVPQSYVDTDSGEEQ